MLSFYQRMRVFQVMFGDGVKVIQRGGAADAESRLDQMRSSDFTKCGAETLPNADETLDHSLVYTKINSAFWKLLTSV